MTNAKAGRPKSDSSAASVALWTLSEFKFMHGDLYRVGYTPKGGVASEILYAALSDSAKTSLRKRVKALGFDWEKMVTACADKNQTYSFEKMLELFPLKRKGSLSMNNVHTALTRNRTNAEPEIANKSPLIELVSYRIEGVDTFDHFLMRDPKQNLFDRRDAMQNGYDLSDTLTDIGRERGFVDAHWHNRSGSSFVHSVSVKSQFGDVAQRFPEGAFVNVSRRFGNRKGLIAKLPIIVRGAQSRNQSRLYVAEVSRASKESQYMLSYEMRITPKSFQQSLLSSMRYIASNGKMDARSTNSNSNSTSLTPNSSALFSPSPPRKKRKLLADADSDLDAQAKPTPPDVLDFSGLSNAPCFSNAPKLNNQFGLSTSASHTVPSPSQPQTFPALPPTLSMPQMNMQQQTQRMQPHTAISTAPPPIKKEKTVRTLTTSSTMNELAHLAMDYARIQGKVVVGEKYKELGFNSRGTMNNYVKIIKLMELHNEKLWTKHTLLRKDRAVAEGTSPSGLWQFNGRERELIKAFICDTVAGSYPQYKTPTRLFNATGDDKIKLGEKYIPNTAALGLQ